MILRKPYAFFIKHFRFIHVILSMLMLYCIFNTKHLLDFFNEYIVEVVNLKGQELIAIYTPGFFQFLPFLIIGVIAVILVVLVIKKKPFLLYAISIVSYIYTIVIIQVAKVTLGNMESAILDIRGVRLVRDVVTISFIFQIVTTTIVLVRTIGFDIKKFDFKEDLKELEIEEADREEFEVQLNFDKNKTRRNIRRKIRFLNYAYKENKLLANIFIISFVVLVFGFGIRQYMKIDRPVNENVYVSNNGMTLKITDSYITRTDYKGKVIDEDSVFVILKINVKATSSNNLNLDVATTKLSVGQYSYIPTYDYVNSFMDFGEAYLGGKLSEDYQEKILVYKIPKQFKNKKIQFAYVNKINLDNKIVKLNLKDLTNDYTTSRVNIGDELDLKESILSTYKLKINNYSIQTKYKLNYKFCYNKVCLPSVEYIVPTINGNEDKSIMRIDGTLTYDKEISKINDLYDLINGFGTIYYDVGGQVKTNKIELKQIKSRKINNKNIFYIEVPRDIEYANSISIKFAIRNKIYEYVLK